MAHAVRLHDWDLVSSQIAAVINSRPGMKPHRMVTAERIHPIRRQQRRALARGEARGVLDGAFAVSPSGRGG